MKKFWKTNKQGQGGVELPERRLEFLWDFVGEKTGIFSNKRSNNLVHISTSTS